MQPIVTYGQRNILTLNILRFSLPQYISRCDNYLYQLWIVHICTCVISVKIEFYLYEIIHDCWRTTCFSQFEPQMVISLAWIVQRILHDITMCMYADFIKTKTKLGVLRFLLNAVHRFHVSLYLVIICIYDEFLTT